MFNLEANYDKANKDLKQSKWRCVQENDAKFGMIDSMMAFDGSLKRDIIRS